MHEQGSFETGSDVVYYTHGAALRLQRFESPAKFDDNQIDSQGLQVSQL